MTTTSTFYGWKTTLVRAFETDAVLSQVPSEDLARFEPVITQALVNDAVQVMCTLPNPTFLSSRRSHDLVYEKLALWNTAAATTSDAVTAAASTARVLSMSHSPSSSYCAWYGIPGKSYTCRAIGPMVSSIPAIVRVASGTLAAPAITLATVTNNFATLAWSAPASSLPASSASTGVTLLWSASRATSLASTGFCGAGSTLPYVTGYVITLSTGAVYNTTTGTSIAFAMTQSQISASVVALGVGGIRSAPSATAQFQASPSQVVNLVGSYVATSSTAGLLSLSFKPPAVLPTTFSSGKFHIAVTGTNFSKNMTVDYNASTVTYVLAPITIPIPGVPFTTTVTMSLTANSVSVNSPSTTITTA